MARWFTKRDKEQEQRDELLSAYLDGQLSAEVRTRLEAELAADPALRAELEALRRTVALVRDLPRVSAPRNFILPQTVAPRPRPVPLRSRRSLAPLLTAATSLAALLFLAVLIGDLLISSASHRALAPAAPLLVEKQEMVVVTAAECQDVMTSPVATPSPTLVPRAMEERGLALTATPIPSPTPVPEACMYATVPPTPTADMLPFAGEEETAPAEGEYIPARTRGGPALPFIRVLTMGLGLIVLVLGGITVWAWRGRR